MISSSNKLLTAGFASVVVAVVAVSSALAASNGMAGHGTARGPLVAEFGHDRHFRHWHHRHVFYGPVFYAPGAIGDAPYRASPADDRPDRSLEAPPDRPPVFSPFRPETPVEQPVAQVTFPAQIIELRAGRQHHSCPQHFSHGSAHVIAR